MEGSSCWKDLETRSLVICAGVKKPSPHCLQSSISVDLHAVSVFLPFSIGCFRQR